MSPESILALMISLAQPGASPYSRVVVTEGSVTPCPAPLSPQSPLCAPPRYDAHHRAFTRVESAEEALKRYWTLARIIARETDAATWRSTQDCPAPAFASSEELFPSCIKLQAARPWTGTTEQLQRYLITVAFHESGFRRDVWTGIGPAARGDCRWRTSAEGKRQRIAGSCRSIGPYQIMKTVRGWRSPRGYPHESLAGPTTGALTRSTQTAIDYLSRARLRCVPRYLGDNPACVLGTYGGVTSARDGRIRLRTSTYRRTAQPVKLVMVHRELLGLPLGESGSDGKLATGE